VLGGDGIGIIIKYKKYLPYVHLANKTTTYSLIIYFLLNSGRRAAGKLRVNE
jgi:hypothetical protein